MDLMVVWGDRIPVCYDYQDDQNLACSCSPTLPEDDPGGRVACCRCWGDPDGRTAYCRYWGDPDGRTAYCRCWDARMDDSAEVFAHYRLVVVYPPNLLCLWRARRL